MINGIHTQLYQTNDAQLASHEARIDGIEKQMDDLGRKIDKVIYLAIAGLGGIAFQLAMALKLAGK